MRFEISHELDAPLDTVELAVLSPDLGSRLARLLKSIESVETVEHVLENGTLRRVLRFQASAPLPILRGYTITRDAMSWREVWVYRLADHASTWEVSPRDEWKRYFHSEGTYKLEPLPDGRTRRVVKGEIEIHAGVIGPLIERMAVSEVRKTYDAEADTLRELSTL